MAIKLIYKKTRYKKDLRAAEPAREFTQLGFQTFKKSAAHSYIVKPKIILVLNIKK